jgi:hypothetical protein
LPDDNFGGAVFRWAIKGVLARGPRPRYGKHWAGQVPRHIVDGWIEKAKTSFGVESVICLLEVRELRFYKHLPLDLISHYRSSGLKVKHVPVRNGTRRFSKKQLKAIWKAYKRLPKPLLITCSAGIGRTGRCLAHLRRKLKA